MFLLVLDRSPSKAAKLVPDKLKFKQLIELCQLICSAGLSDIYKPISRGKQIQDWIKRHQGWVRDYGITLLIECRHYTAISQETADKVRSILWSLPLKITKPKTAVFRYSSDYESYICTNSEISIDVCIEEYKKYVAWKKGRGTRYYV